MRLTWSELSSCVKVEVAVSPGLPVSLSLMVSVDVNGKATFEDEIHSSRHTSLRY